MVYSSLMKREENIKNSLFEEASGSQEGRELDSAFGSKVNNWRSFVADRTDFSKKFEEDFLNHPVIDSTTKDLEIELNCVGNHFKQEVKEGIEEEIKENYMKEKQRVMPFLEDRHAESAGDRSKHENREIAVSAYPVAEALEHSPNDEKYLLNHSALKNSLFNATSDSINMQDTNELKLNSGATIIKNREKDVIDNTLDLSVNMASTPHSNLDINAPAIVNKDVIDSPGNQIKDSTNTYINQIKDASNPYINQIDTKASSLTNHSGSVAKDSETIGNQKHVSASHGKKMSFSNNRDLERSNYEDSFSSHNTLKRTKYMDGTIHVDPACEIVENLENKIKLLSSQIVNYKAIVDSKDNLIKSLKSQIELLKSQESSIDQDYIKMFVGKGFSILNDMKNIEKPVDLNNQVNSLKLENMSLKNIIDELVIRIKEYKTQNNYI